MAEVSNNMGNDISDMDDEEEILYIVCVAACTVCMVMENKRPYIANNALVDDMLREQYLHKLYVKSDRVCHQELRMNRRLFHILCQKLKEKGLRDGRYVRVEEQVAMFLTIIGQDYKNRHTNFNFIRSGETVSRCFNAVLKTVIKLHKEYLKAPDSNASPQNCSRPRSWHHYFKDVVGAIDGTYIHATVAAKDQPRFRSRTSRARRYFVEAFLYDG